MPADAWLYQFVKESWRIEGLDIEAAEPKNGDWTRFTDVHAAFLNNDRPMLEDIEAAAIAFTYGKGQLRQHIGMDVRVGNHYPPRGGQTIPYQLIDVLEEAKFSVKSNTALHKRDRIEMDAFRVHCKYETLHPFIDGNGRTGRMLWAWMMERSMVGYWQRLGFLHTFYYQSLQGSR